MKFIDLEIKQKNVWRVKLFWTELTVCGAIATLTIGPYIEFEKVGSFYACSWGRLMSIQLTPGR